MDVSKLRIMNGAGPVKRLDQVIELARTPVTDITVGSITTEVRTGNVGEVYYFHPVEHWSVNAWGVPSIGKEAWIKTLPDMVKAAHDGGKRLRASVAIFDINEDSGLAADCFECGVDEVEINIGCGNNWSRDGRQKPIPSYYPDITEEIFDRITDRITPRKTDVKVSPVENHETLAKLVDVLVRSGRISAIVGVNTKINQRMLKIDGTPALCFNKVDGKGIEMGGLAGDPLRDESLAFWDFINPLLPSTIDRLGVGGINAGGHIVEYARRKVSGVQIVTDYIQHGAKIFGDRLSEAADLDL